MSEVSGAIPLRPHYDGRGGALGGLTLRTTLLELLSLLLYRFWARTRMRRYLWSHVLLDGDRFEYTGTGGELFRGFLRVVLIFAPISIVIAVLNAFVLPGLNQAQLPVFVMLAIVGSYYARRYRLTRTRWRGIRGNLVGSAGKYLGLSLLHLLHTVLTLGLTYPIYRLATGRYLIAHSWFGDRQFTCRPRYARLWLRYAPIWLVTVLLFGAAAIALAPAIRAGTAGDSAAATRLAQQTVGALVFGVAAVAWWGVMFSLYRLWEFRALLDATRLGELVIRAKPRWRMLLAAALLTGFAVLVAALLCVGLIAGAIFLLTAVNIDSGIAAGVMQQAGPILGTLFAAFVVYPVFLALKAMIWTNALVGELVDRIEIAGEPDFARLEQNRDYVPTSGEGLFDVFDFAG